MLDMQTASQPVPQCVCCPGVPPWGTAKQFGLILQWGAFEELSLDFTYFNCCVCQLLLICRLVMCNTEAVCDWALLSGINHLLLVH